MSDFGSILRNNGNNLTLYCDRVLDSNNAYAVYATTTTAQSVVPGTPQLIDFTSSQQKLLSGIDVNSADTVFTITKPAVYMVECSVGANGLTSAGSQAQLTGVVNGTNITFDVVFGSASGGTSSKVVVKFSVNQVNTTPTNVSFQLSSLVSTVDFRYAQMSITQI
jgi:hypothetical protein